MKTEMSWRFADRQLFCGIEHSRAGGDYIGGVRHFFNVFLHVLNQQIAAELAIQNVGGKNSEHDQHHYGNYGDKKIGDDQAIAQTPQKSRARPSADANHGIAERQNEK